MASQSLDRHPQTGVTEWHSSRVNDVEWELWMEEFMMHQVSPQGEDLPTRLVVANLLQHLSKDNRAFAMRRMREEGILRGVTALQRRSNGANNASEDAPPPPHQDPAAAQLEFLMKHFGEEPQESQEVTQDPRLAQPPQPPEAAPSPVTPFRPPAASRAGGTPAAAAAASPSPGGRGRGGRQQSQSGRGRGGGPGRRGSVGPRICECGAGAPTLGLPGAGRNGAQWCLECPALPLSAVEVGIPDDQAFDPSAAGAESVAKVPKGLCACGKSKPLFALRGCGKRAAKWCSECPDLPPLAVNVMEAIRSELYYKSSRACECQRDSPSLAMPGQPAQWCPACPGLQPGAVSVEMRLCECGRTQPRLNLPGRPTPIWCDRCPRKAPNAVDLTNKSQCQCGRVKVAKMGLPGETPRWCRDCPGKPAEAINLVNKRCVCGKHLATMGMPADRRQDAKWCQLCAPLDAINLSERRCECGKDRPKFGAPGSGPGGARWCTTCPARAADAIDVVSERCSCGLSIKPRFAVPGAPVSSARWCSKCPDRPPHSIDILSRRCECGRGRPSFGLQGGQPRWCAKCPARAARAVDVVNRRCECGRTLPSLGIPEEGTRRWCRNCPDLHPSAVNLKPSNIKCGCTRKRKACFALPGEPRVKARWCSECPDKPEEAVDIIVRRGKGVPVAAPGPAA